MYELAFNPNIQEKLREEIQVTIKATNGKLTYDAISNMHYLDKVIQETLRKHPPATVIPREAVSDHTFSDSKISITKGTRIFIPVYAIHHDPDIYPNPEKFYPERFDKEAVKLRSAMTYLPFGDGPRVCIGKRFADNETKFGLITIIRNWRLEVCDKTCKQYVKRPGFSLLAPKSGLFLRLRRL